MSKELAQVPSLRDRMDYSKALAQSDLLPDAFRGKPANVLLAVEHGQALGIPAMTAIQGIHVIKGKPGLSADLMAALVRRAGHRLRIRVDDGPTAVAQLIRSDDPEYTYECRWDIARAKAADLLGKDNWRNYPQAMLKARATSEVIREGASEVLHGLIYTPEELGAEISDGDEQEPVKFDPGTGVVEADIVDADVVEPATEAAHVEPTAAQLRLLGTLMTRNGISVKADRLAYCDRVVGHPIASSKDLTPDEFQDVVAALQADLAVIEQADAAAPADPTQPEPQEQP